jgi:anthranilate/para-aminobenzoate synthase component I
VHIIPLASGLTPERAALSLSHFRHLSWLDGGLAYGREGEWSFLGVEPTELREVHEGASPWQILDELARPFRPDDRVTAAFDLPIAEVPRWIGHVSYDAWWSGKGPRRLRGGGSPVLSFARYDALLAFDHRNDRVFAVGDDAERCRWLAARANETVTPGTFAAIELTSTPIAAHRSSIEAALEHMRAGDIYQVNLARRYQAAFRGCPLALYLRMRERSPVPLGAFMQRPTFCLLGRSMERFLRYRSSDGALWTSPIKGTLARAGDDASEAVALRADPKEHAEHAMIVDLMRNDLGRVARYGSVHIDTLMEVQPFAGLNHLVSTVRATARDGLTLGQLLAETFAPGSVTGTPKKRAMEIIEALEPHARGIYTGAYGFVDRSGGVSLAVAIRTATLEGDVLTYWAGGGIVVDSQPDKEVAETELKARMFLEACGLR